MILADRSPLYMKIAQDILNAIERGDHAVGSLLPTEQEFCALFGVSRITIRGAMRELEQRSVVSRQPGVGTRVEPGSASYRYVHESSSIEDVLQFTQEMTFRQISRTKTKIDASTALRFSANEGDAFLRIEGLRVAGSLPICHSTHYVPDALASHAKDFDHHKGSLASLLAARANREIEELDQTIEAVNLDSRLADLLAAPNGEAALSTWRRYRDANGRLMIASWSLFPKDRYSYSLRNRREQAVANQARRRHLGVRA